MGKLLQRDHPVPTITQDVVLQHQLQTDSDPTEVTLANGDSVEVVKEWASHYLIKASDGKLFNVSKEYVDASS